MQNRLNLDFSIVYADDRSKFLQTYLLRPEFTTKPPTEEEMETMSNYVLWGKDRESGLNGKQAGLDLPSRNGTWDRETGIESLDALMESPTFNEANLGTIDMVQYTNKREKFSRDEALQNAPVDMQNTFRTLFKMIDETELKINYYELQHGRRVNPPRDWLVNKFSDEEKQNFQEIVTHWNQFKYLKMRHELVELRREQYTLRDSFQPTMQVTTVYGETAFENNVDFDAGIEVLPLGLKKDVQHVNLFYTLRDMHPGLYSDADLKVISDIYWEKQRYTPSLAQRYIDFRNDEHVYQLFLNFYELGMASEVAEYDSNLPLLMKTLEYYINEADLTDLQREILDLKIKKVKNTDVALEINKKWGRSYTANYISTIFKQRIIPRITDAAKYHEQLVSKLFFEEEFKQCSCCKKILLRDAVNFTHKTRSKDGFTTKCKVCEKAARAKE